MEVKAWTYEEFPAFDEDVSDATWLDTNGDEEGVRYIPNVEYECVDGVSRVLQILVPHSRNRPYAREGEPAGELHPCVVYVQGSAWMRQDCYFNLPQIAKLATRGYVVAVVQYRESGIGVFPDQARDARNATRFLRVNAEAYGIDADKFVVMGDSSGGHTVMEYGILHDDDDEEHNLFAGTSAEVSGIINLYGSTDLTFADSNPCTTNHNRPDSPEGMVMGGIDLNEDEAACEALTIRCNISKTTRIAPVLIAHGTKDRTVNTRCSTLLHEHLKACGHDSTLYLLRGADHGGPEFWDERMINVYDEFIRRCVA